MTASLRPGTESRYSNLGYMVLAEVIEKVSNKPFDVYLQERIFEPAGMQRTGIYNAEEIKKIENVAKGYLFYPFTGKYEEAIKLSEFSPNYAISGLKGDGNVYSTTMDLFRFSRMFKSGKLISNHSLEMAFKNHITANKEHGTSFGYGWTTANAPKKVVQRGGELPGYISNLIWNFTDDNLLIYLMNDYHAYLSYHNSIYYAYAGITYSDTLNLPKLQASVELTKIAVKSSPEQFLDKINTIKSQPKLYDIDVNGLRLLVGKLKKLGETDKANIMMEAFKPE